MNCTIICSQSAFSTCATPQRRHLGSVSITSSRCRAILTKGHITKRSRPLINAVVAFKEHEKIQDWRVQQMVDLAHKYFIDYLSKGNESLATEIFDDQIVHKDAVWDPAHPTVGIDGMRHYLHDIKAAFPDFFVQVEQIATCDTNQIWVKYEGSATGMGEYHGHKPSHHTSNFTGMNVVKFNHDRSKITEIEVYRSAFAEDLNEVGEKQMFAEGGFRELRLKRLV